MNTKKIKMNYQLEKYSGRASRHECPKCKDKHSFTYYVDESGQPLNTAVGRCDHEVECGYHYTPKEYFADHPDTSKDWKPSIIVKPQPLKKPTDYLPFDLVSKSHNYRNSFVSFLIKLSDHSTLESPEIEKVCTDYAIGSTKNEAVIYWQIDRNGKVRTGKIMKYDSNGHRIKGAGCVDWVHSKLIKNGTIKADFNLCQCLFGEHLLNMYPHKDVALVEAEKTAIIGAMFYQQYNWVATGGKSQMNIDKLKSLTGKNVLMFPDTDTDGKTFAEWQQVSKTMIFCRNVIVSDLLERSATPEQKAAKIDIADLLVDIRLKEVEQQPPTPLQMLLQKNQQLKNFIDNLI